jgi:hypothetical protein
MKIDDRLISRVGADQLIDFQRDEFQLLFLALVRSKVLAGAEDFDPADGFSEIFSEMSDIAGQKVIRLDGDRGHEDWAIFFRQVDGGRDVGIHFGDDLDVG